MQEPMRPRPKPDPSRAAKLAEHRRSIARWAEHRRLILARVEKLLPAVAEPAPSEDDDEDGDDWVL